MKLLQTKPNVNAPDSDYPFGSMRDDDGTGNGTNADTQFMTDYVQFFEKVFAVSGLTANGLPDNDANGFQLYQALRAIFPLNTKIITGTWNMDTTASISVAHALSDFLKIRSLNCMIVNNTGAAIVPLNGPEGSFSLTDATSVALARVNSGAFDSAAYNNATYYLTIQYVD